MSELTAHCPYCGSSAWFERVDTNGSVNYECSQCYSTSPKSTYEEDDGNDAEILLNTRPLESSARSEGYVQALDDVIAATKNDAGWFGTEVRKICDQLKSAHGGEK